MYLIITRYLLTAATVVVISEVAKRSDKLGGFIAALPLISVLTLIWLYLERQSPEKIALHARYTFWYVIPTLPMFLFPILLSKMGFWLSLLSCLLITVICFGALTMLLKQFGIELK